MKKSSQIRQSFFENKLDIFIFWLKEFFIYFIKNNAAKVVPLDYVEFLCMAKNILLYYSHFFRLNIADTFCEVK